MINRQLHALIMVWSDATDSHRHWLEGRVNTAYKDTKETPQRTVFPMIAGYGPTSMHTLMFKLNDLVKHKDPRLVYDGEDVVGIREEHHEHFAKWALANGYPTPT